MLLLSNIWAVYSQPYCEWDSFMHRHLQPWLRMRMHEVSCLWNYGSLLGPIASSRSLTWANSYLLTTQLHVCLRLSTYLRRSTRSSVNDEQYEHRRNFGKNILVKLMTTPVEFTSSLRRTSGWCDQQTDKWHTWAASTCNGRSKRNGWLQRTGQTVVMNFGGQAQRWLVRPPSGWHKNLF